MPHYWRYLNKKKGSKMDRKITIAKNEFSFYSIKNHDEGITLVTNLIEEERILCL